MSRKRVILAAIFGIAIGSATQASAVCTPVDVIRQRFANQGAGTQVFSDQDGVALITQALKDRSAPSAIVSDRDAYLVVGIWGTLLVYRVRAGQICAVGKDGVFPVTGPAAADIAKRLRQP